MIADLKPYLEYKESSQEWLGDVPKHWSVLVNAVAHTDYAQSGAPIRVALFDDRLEVENPGLLPFGLIVDLLRTADGLATHEIAEKIGLTPRATRHTHRTRQPRGPRLGASPGYRTAGPPSPLLCSRIKILDKPAATT